jgi:methylated-DNA-protein-cysteine methyltransferase-like protein
MTKAASASHRAIHAVVKRIPRGKVATYGQVAALANLPRQARLVGYALNLLPAGSAIPWHRVVNSKGAISPRSIDMGHEQMQAQLLAREGVRLTAGIIALDTHQWRPRLRIIGRGR